MSIEEWVKYTRAARGLIPLVGTALLVSAAGASAAPRLILTEAKVRELRRLIQTPGSPKQLMFRQLAQQVKTRGVTDRNYELAYQATAAAFLYQLTGEIHYCEIASGALRSVYANVTPDSLLPDRGTCRREDGAERTATKFIENGFETATFAEAARPSKRGFVDSAGATSGHSPEIRAGRATTIGIPKGTRTERKEPGLQNRFKRASSPSPKQLGGPGANTSCKHHGKTRRY